MNSVFRIVIALVVFSQSSACQKPHDTVQRASPFDRFEPQGNVAVDNSDVVAPSMLIPVVKRGSKFLCTPTRVWDGDGPVWCAEGARIRLAGIAAREIGETCNSNQPCPKASAIDARDHLASLIGSVVGQSSEGHLLVTGPVLQCVSDGGAGGNRTAAWCVSPRTGDLSCAMVRDGYALVWDKYWRDHKCD